MYVFSIFILVQNSHHKYKTILLLYYTIILGLLSASTAVVGTPTYPDPKQQIFVNVDSILK